MPHHTRSISASWLKRPFRRRRIRIVVLLALILTGFLFLRSLGQAQDGTKNANPKSQRVVGLILTTPFNSSSPFHYLALGSKSSKTDFSRLVPIRVNSTTNSNFFPTHILPELVVSNEINYGELLSLKLSGLDSQTPSLNILGRVGSGGSDPAFTLVTRDSRWLLCSNYGSPTVSLYSLGSPHGPLHIATHTLPVAALADGHLPSSHPHQIIQHPKLDYVFYVPDLGLNTIHTLHLTMGSHLRRGADLIDKFGNSASGYKIDEAIGRGPRHGVISLDGSTLFISFQTSSSMLALPLGPDGTISRSSAIPKPIDTLPADILMQYPSSTRHEMFALSDVHLSANGTKVYVANRRIKPPYLPPRIDEMAISGDSLAIYRITPSPNGPSQSKSPLTLQLERHVNLGCWQPREILSLESSSSTETLVVTCVGGDGIGAGLVVLELGKEEPKIKGRWDAAGAGAWGVAPVKH